MSENNGKNGNGIIRLIAPYIVTGSTAAVIGGAPCLLRDPPTREEVRQMVKEGPYLEDRREIQHRLSKLEAKQDIRDNHINRIKELLNDLTIEVRTATSKGKK